MFNFPFELNSSGGFSTETFNTLPSAGDIIKFLSFGTTLIGSRKKYTHQAVKIKPIHPKKSDSAPKKREKTKKIKIKGYPAVNRN